MTRLRQPQRLVLDTLVDAGVARSRSDALAWCVRLVGQHEEDWLGRAARGDAVGGRRAQQGPGRLTLVTTSSCGRRDEESAAAGRQKA